MTTLGLFGPLREIARKGDLVLLSTRHAVLLTDPGRTRHAWVYVYNHGAQKLRFPAIDSARFDHGRILVEVKLEQIGERCQIVVSLESGLVSDGCAAP